ncbi:MAG: TonB-dependent receptor, partial [Bacteroidales bacterium]
MTHTHTYYTYILFAFIILFTSFSLSAQHYVVKGKIYDANDKLTLPQVHVIPSEGNGAGVVADMDGVYSIALHGTEVELKFSFLGYDEVVKKIKCDDNKTITLNIAMTPTATELAAVQVVGTRFRSDKKTSIQSLEVIGLEHIQKANATTLDKALDNVAGLAIVDNEPQMRGGSGFSSGLGSRVMVLYDEMPILRADAGRPVWNLIPMEDVSQIEVLKGASSVMFGSAAINGAINVRSGLAKDVPETKVKIYTGFYSKPKNKTISPWTNQPPLLMGASLSHTRKIKKLNLTFTAEYASDDGYRGGDLPKQNAPGKRNDIVKAETRFRANAGAQYNFGHGWIASLNANFLYSDNNQFHFWYNADKGLYYTYPGTLSHFKDLMFFIDPTIKYVSPKGGVHVFKNRILFSDNNVLNMEGQDAASQTYYDEYHYKKTFKKAADLDFLVGICNTYANSFGSVFSGNMGNIGSSSGHTANNLALFTKFEKSFLKDKNLSAVLGARWEFANVDDFHENKPIFQAGLNYQIMASHTYFRASVGQGYRVATIAERYITVAVGDYGFFPNENLKSETSLNTELAVKQMFRIGGFEGFVDVAGFYQTYDNYIEFFMGPWRTNAPTLLKSFGFKFFNTGHAVIKGVEATLAGEGKVGDILKYQIQLAYTYSLPQTTEPDFIYASTLTKQYSYMNSSSDPSNKVLK